MGFNPYRKIKRRKSDYALVAVTLGIVAMLVVWPCSAEPFTAQNALTTMETSVPVIAATSKRTSLG